MPGQMIRVHLAGHLSWFDHNKRTWLEYPLSGPTRLSACLAALQLPPAEIAMVVLNRCLVQEADPWLADGDILELYPPLGGGE
jgi:sulfur carrier protein ThiS